MRWPGRGGPPSRSHSRASATLTVLRPSRTIASRLSPRPPSSPWPNSRNGSRAVRHGASVIVASRRVPAPGGLSTRSVPPTAVTRSARPGEARARALLRAAAAVVVDGDQQLLAQQADLGADLGRVGVLERVGQRLGDQVVDRRLDRPGQPALGQRVDAQRQRRARGQRRQRVAEAVLGQPGRVQPAHELAQLVAGQRRLLARLVEQRGRRCRARRPAGARPSRACGRARRGAAGRRRAGCARCAGAPRRPPRRSARARPRSRPRGRAGRPRGGGARSPPRRGRRRSTARRARRRWAPGAGATARRCSRSAPPELPRIATAR